MKSKVITLVFNQFDLNMYVMYSRYIRMYCTNNTGIPSNFFCSLLTVQINGFLNITSTACLLFLGKKQFVFKLFLMILFLYFETKLYNRSLLVSDGAADVVMSSM
jgi:hypothetical protein